jgi:hypothetical protein
MRVMKAYGGVGVYLQSFLTLALDAVATLPTGNELPLCIYQEAGWVPELVWMVWRREKSLATAGISLLCLTYSTCTVVTILVCIEVINMLWSMFSGLMVWFVLKVQRVAAGHGQLKSGGNPE